MQLCKPRRPALNKGTLLGTPNREPQEYSRYVIGIYLPGSLYSIIFLLYSWGSLLGVPSRVPLLNEPELHISHFPDLRDGERTLPPHDLP